ncbi:TonB-dependent receptor [Carboxylicivirga linearis]|uniref:TonB-dependent receptor n=1 Tax=Carboxylicivirga linearis TaxID=1628157 RepID=A0ABS5K1F9_9BACT|nr:TonB-dependent receptor [Carboxylicivirga linearis]MBS2100516.1 TonB-dependent receptor [Carboxylicivirga linearis]
MKKIEYIKNSVISFKQWQGVNYAAFNSLHKVVRIGTMLAVYLSWFGFKQTIAQTDSLSINKKISLEEVEVSARRSTAVYSEVGRILHVISRKEIEKLPVYSVQDLLRYAMNVDVRQRGPLGVQADVSIRGGSFDQVMILFNGINVTDPQTGHLSLNLPVDMQSIESVEILEGPGARVYGPGAFSGAINFVTGSKSTNNATVNAMAGQNGLYNVAANTTIKTGKLKSYAAANVANSDGYIDNTDFKNHSIFYQGLLDLGTEKIDFQVGYNDKEYGANAFYTPKYPEQFEQNKTTFASVKMTTGTKVKITPALYWRRHQDRFELFRNEAPSWYTTHNYHLTDVYGANVNAVIPWKLGKTSFGGELRGENIWSNNIGVDMEEPIDVPGEDAQFTKFYERTNMSTFLEHVYNYNKFSVSAGVLMNWNSSLGIGVDFFPGVDVSYWASNNVKLFGSVNKSLRLPTFTDLFYDGPTNIGNPDLKPEEALTYEGGVKYLNDWFSGQVSAYYRQSENLIDWGRLEGEVEYQTRNLSDMDSYGLTFQGRVNVKELAASSPLTSIDFGYAFIDQDKNAPDDYESVYVLDYLKHKFNVAANFQILKKLTAGVNVQWQDREGGYQKYLETGEEVATDYQPFWLTDMRLQWNEAKYKVYVDASNLFDNTYYDLGNVPQPGRWIKAGVQVSLDW